MGEICSCHKALAPMFAKRAAAFWQQYKRIRATEIARRNGNIFAICPLPRGRAIDHWHRVVLLLLSLGQRFNSAGSDIKQLKELSAVH